MIRREIDSRFKHVFILGILFLKTIYADDYFKLWPLPSNGSFGNVIEQLDSSFVFQPPSNIVKDSKAIKKAIDRYMKIIDVPGKAVGRINKCSLHVKEDGFSESSVVDSDESYTLVIDEANCKISGNNFFGALRGMERFTQLLNRFQNEEQIQISPTPIVITDQPRFNHRGLLIDTSRHFLPVKAIKHLIEALPMGFYNVLHWHLVDAIAFPFKPPSEPDLAKGAFDPSLVYQVADIREISNFGKERGIDVLVEIDIPGHAASWGKGKMSIMADCFEKYSYNINDFALNPTRDETFDVIEGVIEDIISATGLNRIHLGGDEVVYGCWANDTSIIRYMEEEDMIGDYDKLYMQFVQRNNNFLKNRKVSPMYWEEVFTASEMVEGASFPKDVLFQVWTDSKKVSSIVSAGYTAIVSSQDYWYLDHAENNWERMYDYDPVVNLTQMEAALVVGGETTMWGEHVDENNLQSFIFPRALAVGERLWSSTGVISNTDDDQTGLKERLDAQRCRMVNRGFAVSPIEPGFCSISEPLI